MTERTITVEVMKAIKVRFPGAFVWKTADYGTIGIPDFFVALLGEAAFVEMKYQRPGEKLKDLIDVIQLTTCHQLATTLKGRCWIVVFEELGRAVPRSPRPCRVTIWTPRGLFAHLWPQFDGGLGADGRVVPPWQVTPKNRVGGGCEPLPVHVSDHLTAPLAQHGAIRVAGWPYDLVARLIEQSVQGGAMRIRTGR